MVDQILTLSARLVRDVQRAAPRSFYSCEEDGIVFGVDGVTWIDVVVRPCRYLIMPKTPARAPAIHAMNSTRTDTVVSLPYDLVLFVDQYGAYLAP